MGTDATSPPPSPRSDPPAGTPDGPDGPRLSDEEAMGLALEAATRAGTHGDVPVGAVALLDGRVIAVAPQRARAAGGPHGPRRVAGPGRRPPRCLGTWRLTEVTLVVTLEPCPMCAGGLVAARVGRLVFGAADPRAGACGSLYNLCADPRLNHEVSVTAGVRAAEASEQLTTFFAARRPSTAP